MEDFIDECVRRLCELYNMRRYLSMCITRKTSQTFMPLRSVGRNFDDPSPQSHTRLLGVYEHIGSLAIAFKLHRGNNWHSTKVPVESDIVRLHADEK